MIRNFYLCEIMTFRQHRIENNYYNYENILHRIVEVNNTFDSFFYINYLNAYLINKYIICFERINCGI